MEGCPDPLEKIFQKVEEESERRAQKEELRSQKVAGLNGVSVQKSASATSSRRRKERRRGSISISRIGQVPDDEFGSKSQVTLTPKSLAIASNSPFYQYQIANGSTNSIASGASAFSQDHAAHDEDDNQVTQMHHIVGKQSLSSKIMPRRLSRSQSTTVMPSRSNSSVEPTVLIGVSVQEATVESHSEEGEEQVVGRSRRASVVAPNSLRHKTSRATLPGTKPPTNWLAKARNFTMKFRRTTKPSISR